MCNLCEHQYRDEGGKLVGSLPPTCDSTITCMKEHFGIIFKSDLEGFWFENEKGEKLTQHMDSRFNNLGTMLHGMELVAHMVLRGNFNGRLETTVSSVSN